MKASIFKYLKTECAILEQHPSGCHVAIDTECASDCATLDLSVAQAASEIEAKQAAERPFGNVFGTCTNVSER
jgi:hypothetical protein